MTDVETIIEAIAALKGRNIQADGVIERHAAPAETFTGLTDTLGQPLQAPKYVTDVPGL